ncbi:MAG TPA: tRNA (adenosine(37)-N6)-threonylcarbamoyltransferase complex dimerization subunit type 1 TsaB [Phycisphaerae bacterium]|nr:tRNA (adenosine(37)-N6)-threonylcarbamoyltransferase complex dimerization subunit type 1 TsaB [Phycisphaerae bacterium]
MDRPRIIAIETSGRAGSVAIASGPDLVSEAAFTADREHARDLIPMLDDLLVMHGWTPASIEHCYLSVGPGSFTGLRVAVTFARHLALATGAKLCAVPTLDVIARNALSLAQPAERLAVILDAKSQRVFGALYDLVDGEYLRTQGPLHVPPADLLRDAAGMAVTGEGVRYHEAAIRAAGATILDPTMSPPNAKHVHYIGWKMALRNEFAPPETLIPLYVRRPDAELMWEKRMRDKANAADQS